MRIAPPDGHDGQAAVVLGVDGQLQAVGRHLGVGHLVGALRLHKRHVRAVRAARLVHGVAVLLVQHRVERMVRVEPPEPDARHQRAGLLVPDGGELGRREHVDVVQVPERERDAVNQGVDAYLLDVVVEARPQLGLGHVLAALAHVDERHALAQAVHAPLDVQAAEEVARHAQAARREVAHLGSLRREQHLRERRDGLVALPEVVVGADRVAVHLAAPVPLHGILDPAGRASVGQQLGVGDYRAGCQPIVSSRTGSCTPRGPSTSSAWPRRSAARP